MEFPIFKGSYGSIRSFGAWILTRLGLKKRPTSRTAPPSNAIQLKQTRYALDAHLVQNEVGSINCAHSAYGGRIRGFNTCRGEKAQLKEGSRALLAFSIAVALYTIPLNSAASDPIKILAFGDSLTAGYGLAQDEGFTGQLQNALNAGGIQAEVINAGVSGDTSAGGAARIDWALADAPNIIIVELGANDGLRGVEPSSTRQNLSTILDKSVASGATVILAGMLAPPNLGKDFGEEFNAIFPELAAERPDILFYPFFLEGVAAEADLNLADGIHPNAKGVAIIVDRMLPLVKKAIDQSNTS